MRSFALAILGAAACVDVVSAQSAAPPAVQPFLRNWTRVELWRYYDPPPGGGDPDTLHVGNRLQAGVRLRRGIIDATVALQYVQFGGLPSDAIGPGALGTGGLYFDHSGDTSSAQVYLKTASVAFRKIGGAVDVQVGRMPYTSGAERNSGVPKIEAVKRQRLDSRLVGEFEWSLYQRAFDGIRVDWSGSAWQATGTAFQPTQGGFEDAAGVSMDAVRVYSGVLTSAPAALVPHTELQVFGHYYDDERAVTARPDNTGLRADAADIGITSFGAHLVSAVPAAGGEVDVVLWAAGQAGSWYEQEHRAFAFSAEGGYQWPGAPWAPWLRAGFLRCRGDGDRADQTHATFFPMVPTVRRYSQSTLYSLLNVRDAFVTLVGGPRANVTVRVDAHHLRLDSAADGWYAGSGATQEEGRIFGYTLRPSGGETSLMNVLEGSIDWRFNPRWSVNGYLGVGSRGRVVQASFAGGPATFAYVENVIQF